MGFLLGRKVSMTLGFDSDGNNIPVAVVFAGPCKVLEKRISEKNGYSSCVLGFEQVDGAKIRRKAQLGYFKKLGAPCYRVLREFRDLDADVGAELTVSQFKPGDLLKIEGVSKGKGFTSVIKKWNFARGRMSHGGNCKRKMGSSGMHTWPARVIKGKKMAGRWGTDQVTLGSVEVVQVIPSDNVLLIKGPLPGGPGSLLKIYSDSAKKTKKAVGA